MNIESTSSASAPSLFLSSSLSTDELHEPIAFVLPAIPPAIAALGDAAAYVGSAALAGYALSEIVEDKTPSDTDSLDDDEASEDGGESCEKPKCRFVREVYYGGPTKTCWYEKQGQLFTFPQWKDKPCPSIDPNTCMVDTRGLPGSKN